MLYDENMAAMLLGCLFSNTDLLFNPAYPISKKDFSPNEFHRVMFVCCVKLAEGGAKSVDPIEMDSLLNAYPKQAEIARDNNFDEFIETTKELCRLENFPLYYDRVRKFALLRDLQDNGQDVSQWYDELDATASSTKLDQITIQEILDTIEVSIAKCRNKYDVNYVRSEMIAGEDTEELLEEFKQAPAFGAFLMSPYLTQLAQGLNRGHLLMRSSGSGIGKTRMAIGDLCYLSCLRLWDFEAEEFVDNPNYRGKGLLIHTEMQTRKEINPIVLACVSGVDNAKIINGSLDDEETERVLEAGKILQESGLILCDMPDFTNQSIERKVKECVERYGVENVAFDYLQLNSALADEFKRTNGGVPAREDLVVKSTATALKAIAEKYNVRIITSSQLTGHEKEIETPDESCLSSSKAVKQKLDIGCIVMSTKDKPKELKYAEPYLKRRGYGSHADPAPNVITYVYKSRFGLYADQKLKIFSYYDRGTMRIKDYLVMDAYNRPVNIPKPILSKEDNQ